MFFIIAIIAAGIYRHHHSIAENAEEISFCDNVAVSRWRTWKVPEIGPDAVAWTEGHHLYIGQDGGVTAGVLAPHFGQLYPNVRKIQFDGNYDTSNMMSMGLMFGFCENLSELDLSSFDTSNVTNMSYMFNGCDNLSELDLSSFDTSNVTDMIYMFNACDNLSELNLSSFDTSNVTYMMRMFDYCDNLTNLITNDERLKEQYAEDNSN